MAKKKVVKAVKPANKKTAKKVVSKKKSATTKKSKPSAKKSPKKVVGKLKKTANKVNKPTAKTKAKAVVKKIKKATTKKAGKTSVKKAVTKKVVKKAIKKISAPKKIVKKSNIKPALKKVKKNIPSEKVVENKITEKAKVEKPKNTIEIKQTAPKNVVKSEAQKLSDAAIEGILEVKGKNISLLNLTKIQNRVCDYFIICQADSTTQVNAIADSVVETVKKITGEKPYRSEGFENAEWILIDYVTVVVHVFQSHIRDFYNLESLWADAEETKIAYDYQVTFD